MGIGNKLKSLREKLGMKAKDVSAELSKLGFTITDKTLYGYENETRMPNADVFLALCDIYKCKNILETFREIDIDYTVPTDEEFQIIEKIRSLDSFGNDLVLTVLDIECKRCEQQSFQENRAKLHKMLDEQLDLEKREAETSKGFMSG